MRDFIIGLRNYCHVKGKRAYGACSGGDGQCLSSFASPLSLRPALWKNLAKQLFRLLWEAEMGVHGLAPFLLKVWCVTCRNEFTRRDSPEVDCVSPDVIKTLPDRLRSLRGSRLVMCVTYVVCV